MATRRFPLAHVPFAVLALALAPACSGDDDGDDTGESPAVVSTVPVDGATDVDPATSISVTFSRAMNEAAGRLTLAPGGSIAVADGSWNAAGTVFSASPSAALPADTSVTVSLADFAAADGKALGAYSFSFTTAGGADDTPPRIESSMPADGATDVPVNAAALRIVFDEAMDTANGTATIDGGATLGAPAWSAGDTTVTYVLSGLSPRTDYQISLTGFTDVAGNDLGAATIDFTTADGDDLVPPAVIASDPAEGAADVEGGPGTIELTFSEAMDETTGTAVLSDGTTSVGAAPTWSAGGTVATFTVTLLSPRTYTLALQDFADPAGNALDGGPYLGDGVLDFTTVADTNPPEVVSATPAEGTPNVPVALTTLVVEFDEPMTTTATITAFVDVTRSSSVAVAGAWSNGDRTITFDVTGLLALGRTYRLDLRTFTDLAGNAIDPTPVVGDGWLDFMTAPDTVAPTALASTPVEGDTSVFPNLRSVVVTFSEAVDPASIATALADGTATTPLTGVVSPSGDVVTYDVAGLLAVSTTYQIDLTGVTDLAGNALDGTVYLGDGILDFVVPAPPTGFDCTSPLTIGYATSVVGRTYTFDVTGAATGSNGSFACDASGVGDDVVILYDKQSDTIANGGELLHVSATSANSTGLNVEVLSGACAVGATSTQHHCYWNKTDLDVYLDVPAGRYWIWVGRNTSGAFQGATIDVEEVPPTAAEGEGCWLPWDTTSSIYTPPATAGAPHTWTIPATAVNAFDMDVTWGGIGSISCDDTPTYGDIHGVDTVISYTPANPNALIQVVATAGAGSTDEINMEIIDRCESRDPARTSLACAANQRAIELIAPPGTSPVWIWLSTEATSDDWPGATVEVREIVPGPGESCATATTLVPGTNTLNPMSAARLGAPACLAATGNLEWYRYTVTGGRVQITGNAGSEIGVVDPMGNVELGCSADPVNAGIGRLLPVGSQVCIAVPAAAATTLTITDTVDNYTGVGTTTTAVAVMPASSWNTDYWMAASPSWVYFGRSTGDVQRFLNVAVTSTTPMTATSVFSTAANVGYAGLALADEQLFSLDQSSGSSTSRLYRLWDGVAATYTAQTWDLTPSYPADDMRAVTFDGTNLIYATQATNDVDIFSVPVSGAQSPTTLGSNTVIDNVYGIAADATYLYFTAHTVAGNVEGVYRLPRSELGNPAATPVLILPMDVSTTAQPIYLDDTTAATYLYVRSVNPNAIHVVELPGSAAPVYRGTLVELGGTGDFAWTYDPSSTSIYFYETTTVSTGQIVRLY